MKDVLSLRFAILATLSYFDILNFPLTLEEFEEYLYGWSAPKEAIEDEIKNIKDIGHAHGYYFLKGRSEIAEKRKENIKIQKQLWEKTNRFRWLLTLCPFVKMICVCNSLAYNNAKKSSDIDLFIVTENKKLWISRFFMKLLTQIFGMRVHHDKIAGRFCLSFFVTEETMGISKVALDFDPHLAYFVKNMIPIIGDGVYEKFLKENENWTFPYFKRQLTPRRYQYYLNLFSRLVKSLLEAILRIFGDVAESFFYKIQVKKDLDRKKLFPNSDGIIIRKDIFKFHEEDPRKEIAEKFSDTTNYEYFFI